MAKVCSNCILDTNDNPEIVFDSQGICNHCHDYWNAAKTQLFRDERGKQLLKEKVAEIKRDGKGKQYDCIIGVSGGSDSTYVAYLTKELGLRPLAVHLDNGWDSELAVKNIEQIIRKLDLDLYTYVIDWEEFKDLQLAYLKASVVDTEIPTDNAVVGILYQMARKYGVKNIVSGSNLVTEGFLPEHWNYLKHDNLNLNDIHKRFGRVPLKTFPKLGIMKKLYYENLFGLKWFPILNYIAYDGIEVRKLIAEKLDWKPYGWKHNESIFTRFYQGYILPKKFGIDKRKSHCSTCICSGQMTREEAIEEIKLPIYDPELLIEDTEYVIKKLGLTNEQFDEIIDAPPVPHTHYKSIITVGKRFKYILKPIWKLVARD